MRTAATSNGAADGYVNLHSDTQTRPTAAMRRAMTDAEVGDEQRFEDPTVTALVERVAALLGQEAAVLLPSGTMCNEIAFRLHIRPGGDEALLARNAHPLNFEAGGPAAVSGAVLTPLGDDRGMFTPEEVVAAVRPPDHHAPRTRLVSVEQTTNLGGGRVWPLATVRGVLAVAADHRLRTHLDGARLLNAVVASGVPAADWAGGFDSAWVDFTKGLGAPFGAVLAGSAALIEEAWRYKTMLGGAMRQAGIMAAGCLYALDHHVDRLAEDHANARRLAEGLAELPGVTVDPSTVDTNIVVFGVPDPAAFTSTLRHHRVLMSPIDSHRVRAVTHLDVDTAGIDRALSAARATLTAAPV